MDFKNFNERMIFVRENSELSQEEFARRLGLTKSAISGYETGRRIPTDSVLKLVSTTFQIDEEWLKSGEGMPTAKESESALDEVFHQFKCSKFEQAFLNSYFQMPERDRRGFCAYLEQLFHGISMELGEAQPPASDEWTLDRVQEMVAEHWELEKDTLDELSASSFGESNTKIGVG